MTTFIFVSFLYLILTLLYAAKVRDTYQIESGMYQVCIRIFPVFPSSGQLDRKEKITRLPTNKKPGFWPGF